VKPAACFVGEPTQMGVVIGHKGQRAFRVSVHGKTGHSSLAPRGVNAVEYAARLIVKIREIGDRVARSGARDPLYDVPYTTANCGVVHGGTAFNIVPAAKIEVLISAAVHRHLQTNGTDAFDGDRELVERHVERVTLSRKHIQLQNEWGQE
jgi:acetylornithine deacetylase/succinyl-diaminopimelate desuccinylase-like protein